MLIRFRLPLPIYLQSERDDNLSPLSVRFIHNGANVTVTLEDSLLLKVDDHKEPHFRAVDDCIVQIDFPPKSEQVLNSLIQNRDFAAVFRKLLPIANRVNRGFRNFGWVANVHEVKKEENAERVLLKWNAQFQSHGEWHDVVPKPDRRGLYGIFFASTDDTQRRSLSITRWPDISEAIQEDHQAAPEDEFITNALEHLQDGNLRVALFEAFVCLEIVLSQFLRLYFQIRRNFSDEKLKRVFKAGLATRVGLILELILSEKERAEFNLDTVVLASKWRNDVMHNNGHLPTTVAEERIRDAIFAILQLAHRLGFKRDELRAEPAARALASEVVKKYHTPIPTIKFQRRHQVLARFSYPWLEAEVRNAKLVKDQSIFEHVVAFLVESCSKLDRLFVANAHLGVSFDQGLDTLAEYTGGVWKLKYDPSKDESSLNFEQRLIRRSSRRNVLVSTPSDKSTQ